MDNTEYKSDQRTGGDRRNCLNQLDFPYLDSHGNLVLDDRRQNMERRLAYFAQDVSAETRTANSQSPID